MGTTAVSRLTWHWKSVGALTVALTAVAAFAAPALAAQTPPGARDTSVYACPPASVPDSGFTDTAGNTFEAQIDCLAWYAITEGGPGNLPPTQYGPSLTVTRAQMATFVARFIDYVDATLLPAYDGSNNFTDVSSDNVHLTNINRLAQAGIVKGGAGGAPATTYSPNLPVRRDQMASYIARSLSYIFNADTCANVANYFDDDDGNLHEPCINALADLGVVEGNADGAYVPANPVTRGQMSAYLMRSMDILVEQELAAPPAAA